MSDEELLARQTFAAGVRKALLLINLPRPAIASRLGVSTNTITTWGQGSSLPSPQNLARLARLAGITQEEIRSGGVDVVA